MSPQEEKRRDGKVVMDSAAIDSKMLALKSLGVGEFGHLNGNLVSHLTGTYELLKEWGNPDSICHAGLYHVSPSDRPKIRDIIGEEAERLVYLYGACDRVFLYPQIGSPKAVYRDRFTGANRGNLTELFGRFNGLVSAKAFHRFLQAFSIHP